MPVVKVGSRHGIRLATEQLAADFARSADTHLLRLDHRHESPVEIYLTDESTQVAACLWLETRIGRRVGPSTGTNVIGTLALAQRLKTQNRSGSIASLSCDGGGRYAETIYDCAWRQTQRLDLTDWLERFRVYDATGNFEAAIPVHDTPLAT